MTVLRKFVSLIWVVGLLMGAGCTTSPTPTPQPDLTTPGAYPVVTAFPANAYPAPQTPIPGASPFVFDRPLKAGAVTVSGQAPAGVVINIINVTLMGEFLGTGIVDPDGRFAVTVPPLVANIRVGLEIADEGASGFGLQDFLNPAFWGPGYLSLPQVGYFPDTLMVEP